MARVLSDSSLERGDAGEFFRNLAMNKIERPTAPRSYSRWTAVVLGAILGLAYGLSTQFINSIFSASPASIPFAHHPFGIIGNCIASMLGLVLICLACSSPKDTYRGALLGSFALVLILELRALFIGTPLIKELRSFSSVFALMGLLIEVVVSIPAMVVLRWTIEIQAELFDKPIWSWRRVRLPLAFTVAAVALGFFSLYPADVRDAMANATILINQGLAVRTPGDLPAPLRDEGGVHDFLHNAQPPYSLELGDNSLFAQDISPQFQGYALVIIARFKGGWTIACLYINRPDHPLCRGYGPPNAPPVTDFSAARVRPPS